MKRSMGDGVALAALKAAVKIKGAQTNIHANDGAVYTDRYGRIWVKASIGVSAEQVQAENPSRPDGREDRRITERRGHDRRFRGEGRGGNDARKKRERRKQERRAGTPTPPRERWWTMPGIETRHPNPRPPAWYRLPGWFMGKGRE
jgi:hypothetical protein